MNVYFFGSWFNMKMFIFVFSCYFVFDVEMKNDKELFNVLFFVFLIRKKKMIEDFNFKRRRE